MDQLAMEAAMPGPTGRPFRRRLDPPQQDVVELDLHPGFDDGPEPPVFPDARGVEVRKLIAGGEHIFPLILGFDAAGTIERVGEGVEGLGRGDDVFGFLFKVPLGPAPTRST
jgi:hypothetical protein